MASTPSKTPPICVRRWPTAASSTPASSASSSTTPAGHTCRERTRVRYSRSMYSRDRIESAFALRAMGLTQAAIAARLGVSPTTTRRWLSSGTPDAAEFAHRLSRPCSLNRCDVRTEMDPSAYAYLLGLYLGDGTLAQAPRRQNVMRLEISCCDDYPGLLIECRNAISAVIPGKPVGGQTISRLLRRLVVLAPLDLPVSSARAGRKHERPIVLLTGNGRSCSMRTRTCSCAASSTLTAAAASIGSLPAARRTNTPGPVRQPLSGHPADLPRSLRTDRRRGAEQQPGQPLGRQTAECRDPRRRGGTEGVSARGGTRTHTPLRTTDFESVASAIPPLGRVTDRGYPGSVLPRR